MCNRARLDSSLETLRTRFNAIWGATVPNKPTFELYPASPTPTIRSAEGHCIIDIMKWGVLGDDKARKVSAPTSASSPNGGG